MCKHKIKFYMCTHCLKALGYFIVGFLFIRFCCSTMYIFLTKLQRFHNFCCTEYFVQLIF